MSLADLLGRSEEAPGPSLAPRALGYAVAGAVPLIAAVATGDAPLAALGLPFLLVLLGALALDVPASEATISAELSGEPETVETGAPLQVRIALAASRPVARCRVELLRQLDGYGPGELARREIAEQIASVRLDRPPRWLCRLGPREPTELFFEVVLTRPGELTLGPLSLLVSGPFGLYRRRLQLETKLRVAARPAEERLRALPRSSRVRVAVGDRLARHTGEGIELAEVRPERPGDRTLPVNWRATARRGVTHVTVRHPEQSTDVVLFADTFDPAVLPRVLEVAAPLAAAYLSRRDRVGLVSFGGVIDWVEASAGSRQLERIRLRLAATSPFFSYAWKSIDRIPPRALPSGALVVAISPLGDERMISALAAIRARGHDVVVVEMAKPRMAPRTELEQAGRLLDEMEREELRRGLFALGIAVAPLEPARPVEAVVAELARAARRLRPARTR